MVAVLDTNSIASISQFNQLLIELGNKIPQNESIEFNCYRCENHILSDRCLYFSFWVMQVDKLWCIDCQFI